MIFDAQGADELFLVDIKASREQRTFPIDVVQKIIKKCRLPIAVGGGVRSTSDALKLFEAGADKIVLNSAIFTTPNLVTEVANKIGSQAVNVSIDVKLEDDKYLVYVDCGTRSTSLTLAEAIRRVQDLGAGEITLTSIDREGSLKGFDIELYQQATRLTQVPLIASGGCGRYQDLIDLAQVNGVDGFGIGKMLCLRDYDIVRIKAYIKGKSIKTREA
jgi:cyclase